MQVCCGLSVGFTVISLLEWHFFHVSSFLSCYSLLMEFRIFSDRIWHGAQTLHIMMLIWLFGLSKCCTPFLGFLHEEVDVCFLHMRQGQAYQHMNQFLMNLLELLQHIRGRRNIHFVVRGGFDAAMASRWDERWRSFLDTYDGSLCVEYELPSLEARSQSMSQISWFSLNF